MKYVTCVTAPAHDAGTAIGEPGRATRPGRGDDRNSPELSIRRLRSALARADRPVRARVLAYDLGLPTAEVTAQLRHLQDRGVAASHDRRWTATDAGPGPTDSVPVGG